ncbi:MAG TPA: 50S ribosomal protein L19e [Candidatus Woesearchaeota archaeon]|nr:50S ribosomal protein L19e [Candidatus Woesearchaeota archaeon]
MNLKIKKRIAADILKCSQDRVSFDELSLAEIKEAITREDLKILIHKGAIIKLPARGISNSRAKKLQEKKKKGHRKGHGSRKGTAGARQSRKDTWMAKIRKQRIFLKEIKLKGLITDKAYRQIYRKAKSGFFRSLRHMKYFMSEKEFFAKDQKREKKD